MMVRVLGDVRDLAGAAELSGQSLDAFTRELASFPDGIRAVAAVDGAQVLATGLDLAREVPRTGHGKLVRVRARALAPALALVDWAEAESRRAGAHTQQVGVLAAPGLAAALIERDYRVIESYVTMRRGCGPRACPSLPAGFHEQTLAQAGEETFVALANAAFEGVPGAFPLTGGDFARVRAEPGFAEGLVRVVSAPDGPVGFLRGALVPGNAGEIDSLGLLPSARGRGLGRWLLRRCEELLDAAGAPAITLLVAASNRAAAALYLRDGYVETARRDTYELELTSTSSGR